MIQPVRYFVIENCVVLLNVRVFSSQLLNSKQKIMDNQYKKVFETIYDGIIISDLSTGLIVEANSSASKIHGYTLKNFIGLLITNLIHPEDQKILADKIRGFSSNGFLDAQIKHVTLDGKSFYAEWRGTAIEYQGRQCLLSIIRDVSKRNQAEQILRERIETRTHEQNTLLAISHRLASTLELQPELILDQLREILQYSHGGLFAVENSSLIAMAMRGTPDIEHWLPFQIHLKGSEFLANQFPGHRPIRIPDIWDETNQSQTLRSLLEDGAGVLLKGMQSWMWVPLTAKNQILGCIGVAHEKKNHFSSHHADLALSVANQAAITMANAGLYEQAQTLAALEERQRLARNLHDAINQSLFSAGIISEVLPRLWNQDKDLVFNSLGDLRRLIRGAQAEMRALLAELRPSTLTDSNLDDLLHLLGNSLSCRIDIPVEVSVHEDVVLPSEVQIAFYRVCQEALNNIVKHANASRVEIILTQTSKATELCIRDNGQGFTVDQTDPGQYGLKMMSERMVSVNAELIINSQPGHGTELKVRWMNPPQKRAK